MPDNSSKLELAPRVENVNVKKKENLKEFKEVSNLSADVGTEAYGEVLGNEESVETADKVSETMSEDRSVKGEGGMKAKKDKKQTAAQIKADLLKNIPSEKEMKALVKKEIKKEIKYLRKKAMRMLRSNEVSYYEMSNLMKKIRELRNILSSLLKLSVEAMKTLWLRFVHGLM
jgi:hypothetical protein